MTKVQGEQEMTEADWAAIEAWDGREATPGGSLNSRVIPRLIGPAVDNFKRLVGICPVDDCSKIDGHDGGCG